MGDGAHRLVMAQMIGIEKIPVAVLLVHKLAQKKILFYII